MTTDPVTNPAKLSSYRFENFFKVYEDTDYKWLFYNILKNISIFPANDPSVEDDYVIQGHDTWVYISYKYYNTMDLWWLVCEYNGITNPTEFPETGSTIKLLKSNYVYSVLSELNKQLSR